MHASVEWLVLNPNWLSEVSINGFRRESRRDSKTFEEILVIVVIAMGR